MCCRVFLCHYKSVSCYALCCGLLLKFLSDDVFKLSQGQVCGIYWLEKLHSVLRRKIFEFDWEHFYSSLHRLFIRNVCAFWFNDLLDLCSREVSTDSRSVYVFELLSRKIVECGKILLQRLRFRPI